MTSRCSPGRTGGGYREQGAGGDQPARSDATRGGYPRDARLQRAEKRPGKHPCSHLGGSGEQYPGPVIDRKMALADAAEAHRLLETSKPLGKMVASRRIGPFYSLLLGWAALPLRRKAECLRSVFLEDKLRLLEKNSRVGGDGFRRATRFHLWWTGPL